MIPYLFVMACDQGTRFTGFKLVDAIAARNLDDMRQFFKLPGPTERSILRRCIMLVPQAPRLAYSPTAVVFGVSSMKRDLKI